MGATLLITVIISYILSLVLSLVLMIFSKRFTAQARKMIFIFHLAMFLTYFFSLLFFKEQSGIFFLQFFCFGVAVAGLVVRSDSRLPIKIYYSIFLLSVLVFLYSPSLLFSLLAKQEFPKKQGIEFLLVENYYLIKEKSMLDISGDLAKYKIIRRTGKFNKTINRSISFHHEIDSVKVLSFKENESALMRGYFANQNKMTDSTEILSDLVMKDENEITIKH